jgi:hypothetical protein
MQGEKGEGEERGEKEGGKEREEGTNLSVRWASRSELSEIRRHSDGVLSLLGPLCPAM